ncbi:hypothetical protein Adt_33705 [Abeliophyllum distichum]|uniref:Uncharacterized protein n=1 Tax=Abeliophyllum distichum TaxID=126358 RepID=A0ABD1QX00_9LAMI
MQTICSSPSLREAEDKRVDYSLLAPPPTTRSSIADPTYLCTNHKSKSLPNNYFVGINATHHYTPILSISSKHSWKMDDTFEELLPSRKGQCDHEAQVLELLAKLLSVCFTDFPDAFSDFRLITQILHCSKHRFEQKIKMGNSCKAFLMHNS